MFDGVGVVGARAIHELVRDMYSHLNLIINELHSIGLTKLDDADIVRNIISLLPQKKYATMKHLVWFW